MQTVFHARCARLKWSFRFVRLPASRQCEGAQLQILGSTHPWTAAAKLMPLAMLLGAAALGWRAALAPSRFALLHRSAPPPLMLAASDTDQAKRALVMETARSAFLFADTDASGVLDREEVSTLMQRMMTVSESNDVDDLSDSSAGGPDPLEVTEADLIKEQADLMEEVEAVFAQYSHDESGDLTYEDFLLLLSQCSTETALFNGLLCFAEGAVSAGVQFRFSEVSAKEVKAMGRKGSHILDDGTPAWRESIEAAFELCDDTGTGEVTGPNPNRHRHRRAARDRRRCTARLVCPEHKTHHAELACGVCVPNPNPNPNPNPYPTPNPNLVRSIRSS